MQGGDVAKQVARWTALIALFLVPLTPLVVGNSFFFPFITGKAFYFRILIEIAVAGWAVLALLDRSYRPRFSYAGAAVVLFVLWMFIADAFAPNALKAFWSNYERMEGWVLLIHLLGLFFAAGAVLRVERKWRAWFLTSLAVSLVVIGHSLLQLNGSLDIHQGSTRIDASFGNSAYLAVYLLFNVFIASWLALTERMALLKRSLLVLAAVEALLIFFTETRGTVIALIVGLLVSSALATFTGTLRTRRIAGVALAVLLLFSSVFYLARNSSFVQNNHVLHRVASISPSDGAVRFTIWKMAFEGIAARPILGWGQEGFNYVFNTYYDPSLYHQEPWFDRAHNAFIDWLSAGGVPAFLLYLSLFGSALYLLWRRTELSRPERIALTAALVGYGVHNLFVFDNLYSYVYFFAILALIDSQVGTPIARLEAAPLLSREQGVTYALPISAVLLAAVIWFVNVPGMTAASKLIVALTQEQQAPAAAILTFENLAAHPGFAIQEVREQLVDAASKLSANTAVSDTDKQRIVTLALTEMKKQVAAYPNDARERLQLSYAYRVAGDIKNALVEAQAASALSPKNENLLIQAGATAWDAGDIKAAQADFNTAYALAPQFSDLAEYAAAGDIAAGDMAAADALLTKAFGSVTVDSDILSVAYYRMKNWERLIDIWKLRVNKPDATAQTWFSLAAAYYTAGQKGNAIATIRAAVAKFPDAAASGAAALQQIGPGQ